MLEIAAEVGRPMEVDLCMANLVRGAFARVCIKVDLSKPIVAGCSVRSTEEVTDFFQEFVCEGIGVYCCHCGMGGQQMANCLCPEANGLR